MPLPIYTPCIRVNDGSAEDYLELITQYFRQDYNNLEILEFLKLHRVSISLSTLKRRLASIGLLRKTNISDDELRSANEKELGKSGCFVGYRKMWARIRKRGLNYSQKSKSSDSFEGTRSRRCRNLVKEKVTSSCISYKRGKFYLAY